MQTGLDEIRKRTLDDSKKMRRRYLVLGLALLILFCAFVCTRTTAIGFVSPVQAVSNLATALQLQIAKWFNLPMYLDRREIISGQSYYLETLGRFEGAVLVVALGAALSVGGAVFQVAFRNPIATPSILGTSGGMRLINMLLVLQFSTAAATMTKYRVIYGYIGTLVILGLMMLGSKLMSKQRSSRADILLIGTFGTRILTQIVNYVQNYVLSEDDYLVLQELNLYGSGTGTTDGMAIALIVIVIALIPLYLTRMSMNTLSFDDEDARGLGIRTAGLRGVAVVCSVLLSTSTLVYAGDVGMLAMMIPLICRYVFGSDTRKLLPACAMSGALLMLVCRIIVSLFAYNVYLSYVSIGTIVELVSTPLMIVVIFRNRRGWE
ncbi:MAG: iron ABC transporter permease [Clostridiales bacterium]|nr:iron ABC transporter permease [Clostridiales bacterium]MCD8110723.1 iron ABC transporter permease [Clostridiales bacterium]MCD8132577.1 iron ABC transporter permease [Clostridiales bacterium]